MYHPMLWMVRNFLLGTFLSTPETCFPGDFIIPPYLLHLLQKLPQVLLLPLRQYTVPSTDLATARGGHPEDVTPG